MAIGYPERMTPMLRVAAMCDLPVLLADRVDAGFGEQLIALAALEQRGILIVPGSGHSDRARSLARERLRRWIILDWLGDEDLRRFRELVVDTRVERDLTSPCTIVFDHAFNARGVGTVAPGFVRRGVLRVHDELPLVPRGTAVTIRSIQRFDEDQTEAPAGSRVGVALKGVEADELDRGAVLTADPKADASVSVVVEPFARVEFAKDAIEPGTRGLHLSAGLYTRPLVVDEIGRRLRVSADRAIPCLPREVAFLTVLRGPGSLRILGTGQFPP